ncbi:hypothetical protein BUZ67_09470 [Staphylococcus pasteuri]|uniref:hypothetical protein n=1 Tax=Staphylococcus pasteuri TaxID=45972 RepID=UPI000D3B0742|nr:hypothetical protein [Staphylococcus pasteuri]PTU84002.1 hypothetical protein BUZ67_09470 [Staphylococcus pasteuri]
MNTDLLSKMLDNNGLMFSYNGIDEFNVIVNDNEILIKDDVTAYEIEYNDSHDIAHSETEVIEIIEGLKFI